MSFLTDMAASYKSAATKRLKSVEMNLLGSLRGRLSAFGISMPIGSLGNIVFQVSSNKVVTFDNFKRTTKARTASHDIIGQKPIIEYLGPDGEEITFTMLFRMDCGVTPSEEVAKVREMCQKGTAAYFVLCNEMIGDNKWIVTDVGETANFIDNMGRIISSQIEVTIKEYIDAFY